MIIAIVGMPGAGKSTLADMFAKNGFQLVRLGQLTMDIIKEKGLETSEVTEKKIREDLRNHHGMDAFAKLNFTRIDELLKTGRVVIDGLYSWEEYMCFKEKYGDFTVVAVVASPDIRYERLKNRVVRPLSTEEATARDNAELENLNKTKPINKADHTIVNEGTIEDLDEQFRKLLESLS